MFKFITNRPFWVNLLAAIALALLLIFLFLQLLGRITQHGKYLTVPSVMGLKTKQAIKLLEEKGFEVSILDSVYTDTAKMGIVLKQLPEANSTVKINRTVLLTVNRVTLPLVEMPSLENKTLGFALEIMRRTHFKLGDTSFRSHFARGSVLEQNYNGKKIAPGTKIPWGSTIDLVIGGGLSEDKFMVPNLVGLTVAEAKAILDEKQVLLAAMIPYSSSETIKDTAGAFIIIQKPPRFNDEKEPVYMQSGQLMDVWISPVMRAPYDSTDNKY